MRRLKVLYTIFGVMVLALIVGGISLAQPAAEQLKTIKEASSPEIVEPTPAADVNESTQSVDVTQPDVNTTSSVPAATTAPVVQQPAPEPAKTEAGGHIPFTSQPVTPGDPQSYVGTVGQCPFYEMAGDKGCYPPADIECNADWSVCTYKGGN